MAQLAQYPFGITILRMSPWKTVEPTRCPSAIEEYLKQVLFSYKLAPNLLTISGCHP